MSLSRASYRASLITIRDDALGDSNPYELKTDQAHNLNRVLNTLIYLIDNMDSDLIKNGTSLHIPDGSNLAPIHLENHIPGERRENVLTETLLSTFVGCFDGLKPFGNDPIQIFCSKMRGFCIEGTTRDAFNYATSLIYGLELEEVAQVESANEEKLGSMMNEFKEPSIDQKSKRRELSPIELHLIADPTYKKAYRVFRKAGLFHPDDKLECPNKLLHNTLKKFGFFDHSDKARAESFREAVHCDRKEYRDYVLSSALRPRR